MSSQWERDAFAYATRVYARLPRCLQECREAVKVSRYRLRKGCGVSCDMIGNIENGESVPTLRLAARVACELEMTLTEFAPSYPN